MPTVAASNLTAGICTTDRTDCGADLPPVSYNQLSKNPRKAVLRGLDAPPPIPVSQIEWEDRVELAALGRIMYMYGFGGDLAAQC